MESWRDVIGYENKYQVSNTGKVRNTNTGRILKPAVRPDGYLRLSLAQEGTNKSYYVHRIVAESWIENPEELPEVNHIDGIKSNNYKINLEWCSKIQNSKHSFSIGLQDNKCEKHPRSKFTNEQVSEIKKMLDDGVMKIKDIASLYNVHRTTIGSIKKERNWKIIIPKDTSDLESC